MHRINYSDGLSGRIVVFSTIRYPTGYFSILTSWLVNITFLFSYFVIKNKVFITSDEMANFKQLSQNFRKTVQKKIQNKR